LRIGIDVSWAQMGPSGTATYVAGLVEALTRVGAEHDYVLFTRRPERYGPALPDLDRPNIARVAVDAPLTNLRQQVALPPALRRGRLDLYHSPAFFLPLALPLLWRGPTVVSMFDLNFLRLRENWRAGRRATYLSLVVQAPIAARQATRIITLSETSARDIARLLRAPPHKIAVVPAAPRDTFRDLPGARAVARARESYGRFFLSVGVLAPQKNLARVLAAFARLDDGATRLVLAGRPAGAYAEAVLRPLARELGVEGRVVFAGATSDDELRALYHAAEALVFPSLGEGFGLPIVEAMACGCPVVTSNLSSMPEVAGDAALLVDPHDVASIAQALRSLLRDPALRAALVARGSARAARYTWDEAARGTLRVYEQAMDAWRASGRDAR
jgi:glycosyltransferase involved in cell wall biosynthesis